MNFAAAPLPNIDAIPLGVGGLVMDVRDATAPWLMQQDGSWIADLLPVIVFMVISVVPTLIQARKKAKERQSSGTPPKAPDTTVQPALGGKTESQDRVSGSSGASGNTSGDLEARVKRYFEELVGPPEATTPKPPPPPRAPARPTAPRPTAPAAKPRQASPPAPSRSNSGSLVDAHVELGDAHVSLGDAHIELRGLDRKKLPSRQDDVPQRARSQQRRTGRSRRTHPLLQGRSLRDAMVLREVFGPPKSLE